MLFRGRKSRAAVLERDLSEAGSRAIETIGDIAEHAISAAREAGHAAQPAIQHSAERLGKAFERAAEELAVTGDRFAKKGEHRAAEAALVARQRLAEASEKLAETIRPKKKHHRVRNALIAVAVVGGVVALVQSPLRAKIAERLFGPSPEEEPESIQLPGTESLGSSSQSSSTQASGSEFGDATSSNEPSIDTQSTPNDGAVEGNGVPSQSGREAQA